MKSKLTSRKFWLAVITIITGILGLFGVADTTIETVSSILLILVPAIVYIFAEGKIDAAAAKKIDFEALLKEIQVLFKIKEENYQEQHKQTAKKSIDAIQATESAG